MINRRLSEAKQGFAVHDDRDQATFRRFIRWTYTKDYLVPDYTRAPTREGTDTPEGLKTEEAQKEALASDDFFASSSDDFIAPWGEGPKSNKTKKTENSTSMLNRTLRETVFDQHDYWSVESLPRPRSNVHPEEDLTEILLFHAAYTSSQKSTISSRSRSCPARNSVAQ